MTHTLILVVDDRLDVRRVVADWLKHDGYDVVEADGVYSAAQAIREITDLRMVLTDLQFTNGTARDLHQKVGSLIQERQGLFVVMTGFNFDDPDLKPYGDYFTEHGIRVFHKPIQFGAGLIPFLGRFRDALSG